MYLWKRWENKCFKLHLLILKRRQLMGHLDIDGNMNWNVSLVRYEGGFVQVWLGYTCGLLWTSLWVKVGALQLLTGIAEFCCVAIVLNYSHFWVVFTHTHTHSKDLFRHFLGGTHCLHLESCWGLFWTTRKEGQYQLSLRFVCSDRQKFPSALLVSYWYIPPSPPHISSAAIWTRLSPQI